MRSVLKQEPKKWAEPLEAEAPNISEAPGWRLQHVSFALL